ncbi:hypothetical protein PCE1_002176 [Barthelona sp. PCE]
MPFKSKFNLKKKKKEEDEENSSEEEEEKPKSKFSLGKKSSGSKFSSKLGSKKKDEDDSKEEDDENDEKKEARPISDYKHTSRFTTIDESLKDKLCKLDASFKANSKSIKKISGEKFSSLAEVDTLLKDAESFVYSALNATDSGSNYIVNQFYKLNILESTGLKCKKLLSNEIVERTLPGEFVGHIMESLKTEYNLLNNKLNSLRSCIESEETTNFAKVLPEILKINQESIRVMSSKIEYLTNAYDPLYESLVDYNSKFKNEDLARKEILFGPLPPKKEEEEKSSIKSPLGRKLGGSLGKGKLGGGKKLNLGGLKKSDGEGKPKKLNLSSGKLGSSLKKKDDSKEEDTDGEKNEEKPKKKLSLKLKK